MPFTFSHPAAVIPIQRVLRQRAVLSALVIGSMAPDFQNFLPISVERAESHSLAGIFWFSLPVGMALYLIFHLLLKKPLCALLPPSTASKLAALISGPSLPPASGLLVVLSLLIGILTHLAWDACTHYSFVTTTVLPALTYHWFSIGSYHVYPYKLLQHASTLAGAMLLWYWCRQWLQRVSIPMQSWPPGAVGTLNTRQRLAAVGIMFVVPLLTGISRAAYSWLASYVPMTLHDLVREAVVTTISSFGLILLMYSVLWHSVFARPERNSSRPRGTS